MGSFPANDQFYQNSDSPITITFPGSIIAHQFFYSLATSVVQQIENIDFLLLIPNFQLAFSPFPKMSACNLLCKYVATTLARMTFHIQQPNNQLLDVHNKLMCLVHCSSFLACSSEKEILEQSFTWMQQLLTQDELFYNMQWPNDQLNVMMYMQQQQLTVYQFNHW